MSLAGSACLSQGHCDDEMEGERLRCFRFASVSDEIFPAVGGTKVPMCRVRRVCKVSESILQMMRRGCSCTGNRMYVMCSDALDLEIQSSPNLISLLRLEE